MNDSANAVQNGSWLPASFLPDGLHSGEGLAAGQPASFLPDGLHSGEGLAAGQQASCILLT